MIPLDSIWLQLAVVLFLTVLFYNWFIKYSTPLPELHKKAVLITGCDTGFGYELTKRLDKLGVTVFAGCLFPDGDGAKQLKSVCSSNLHVLQLDVTSDEDVRNAVSVVKKSLGEKVLWAVVNNAGVTTFGNMEWMTIDTIKQIFDVNTLGPVRITNAFLPLLRTSRGRLVFVSSVGGRITCPAVGVYGMSKHATVGFVNTLRYELSQWGISIHDIQPGMFRTNISSHDNLRKSLDRHWSLLPEDIKSVYGEAYLEYYKNVTVNRMLLFSSPNSSVYQVIDALQDAVIGSRPKNVYYPGFISKFYHYGLRSIPQKLLIFYLVAFLPKIQTDFKGSKQNQKNDNQNANIKTK